MRKILKFGGESLGSASAMKEVAKIIRGEQAQLSVISAMYSSYEHLVAIVGDELSKIEVLKKIYVKCIEELLVENKTTGMEAVEECFSVIEKSKDPHKIMAQADILTTRIFVLYASESGMNVELLYAPDFIHVDQDGKLKVDNLMLRPDIYYITQGFICSDLNGHISYLGPGGGDHIATLLGAAMGSDEVQIWTYDKVLRTGDPRFVEGTRPLENMSYSQAAELAYFGAPVLNPTIIQPCRDAKVDVVIRNTADPLFVGTRISGEHNDIKFLAASSKDNITLIRITSDIMLRTYGFLRKVLAVFEKHETSVDMVTTSEIAVSITVEDTHAIAQIAEDLREYGRVEIEKNHTMVCIVGNMDYSNGGIAAQVFENIKEIPIKMISYGSSQKNLSLLIDKCYKREILQSINTLF